MNTITEAPTTQPRKEAAGIVKRSSAFSADPYSIGRREGWNPRTDFGEIAELAKSIKANGLLNPLRVKRVAPYSGGQGGALVHFELIDGDRRLSAIELCLKEGHAFPEGIPIIIVDKAQTEVDGLIQMFEANTGKPFTAIEEATAYKRMRDAGMTLKEIGKRVGRAMPHVTSILALLDADESVQEAVKEGAIGKMMAKEIAAKAKGDKEKQKELVAAAKAAGGDKKAKRAVKAKVEKVRVEKAAARGKTIKAKPLGPEALSALGAQVAELCLRKLKDARIEAAGKTEEEVVKWLKSDDKIAAAASYGAFLALKAAAGAQDISLDF